MGSTYAPDSLLGLAAPRDPKDEGLLYGFEPCASLRVEVELAAAGATELIMVDGWARDMGRATDSIARHLGIAPVAPETLNRALSRRRGLILPPPPKKPRYAFSQDAKRRARPERRVLRPSSPMLSDRAQCSVTAKFFPFTAIRD
jgi:cyclic beta-1,2-glucan synthetase